MSILSPIFFTSHSLLCNGHNARQTLLGDFTHCWEAFCTNIILSMLVFIYRLLLFWGEGGGGGGIKWTFSKMAQ